MTKEVKRTEQIVLQKNEQLSLLCHNVKNLYNSANYVVRQEFFKPPPEGGHRKWIRYNHLYDQFKNSSEARALPAQTTQQTLKTLDKNWKAFFEAMKSRKADKYKFLGLPKPPNYKKKDGEMTAKFTNQQVHIKDKHVIFPKRAEIDPVKTRFDDTLDLDEVRIVPYPTHYMCEIVYTIKVPTISEKFKSEKIIGIDIGIENAITIVNNIGIDPVVIKGGVLKSINQFYNKEHARLKSVLDKQRKGQSDVGSSKLDNLTWRRNKKINSVMHQISKFVIDYATSIGADTIVVGKNIGWKQGVNLGSVTNQNFVMIPFARLIEQIQYKAEPAGIKVILCDEAHTSRCSFLDNEEIRHHDRYIGKRISRGLFKSASGKIINADCNGAYNIIRKVFPKAFPDGIEGVGLHPKRTTLLKIEHHKS